MSAVHRIELVSDFLGAGWTAKCLCGWEGVEQDTMREASADSRSHILFEAMREKEEEGDA